MMKYNQKKKKKTNLTLDKGVIALVVTVWPPFCDVFDHLTRCSPEVFCDRPGQEVGFSDFRVHIFLSAL